MAVQVKPFTLRRSPTPKEYTGRIWLLKRDDPDVWFGAENGVVFTGTVYSGGDFNEDAFLKPVPVQDQDRVRSQGKHFGKTMELELRYHGALARTARDGRGQPLTMKAFHHPVSRRCCVAGWDPERKVWVVEA